MQNTIFVDLYKKFSSQNEIFRALHAPSSLNSNLNRWKLKFKVQTKYFILFKTYETTVPGRDTPVLWVLADIAWGDLDLTLVPRRPEGKPAKWSA